MTKPTAYEMFLENQKALNRIEDKLTSDIRENSHRIDVVETKTDGLMGKIGIGIMVMSSMLALTLTVIYEWLKGLAGK